jgi:glycosyltransferase involved in cell wall biosynthesis
VEHRNSCRREKTGFLYEPGDAQELASKIGHFYVNRALRDSMGAKAKPYARERFHQETYGRQVEDVLRRAVA